MKKKMTPEEIKAGIAALMDDPDVKAAKKYYAEQYKDRQRLYQLRWYAKKGRELNAGKTGI